MTIQQTSLSAYYDISAELGERQMQVYLALRSLGEANNLMLSRKLSLPINSITPRIIELRKLGMVKESYKDSCPITGRRTIFWRCAK